MRHLTTPLNPIRKIPVLPPLAALVLCAAVPAQSAVSPADRADLEGSNSTSYPLGRHDARVQVLYADLGTALTQISGHAYRRDAISTRGQVGAFTADIEVTLSMSPLDPSTASTTFANNAGPSPVVVLPRTTVSFPATNRPAMDPAPSFDLVVPYQTPFAMPAQGGVLCVDITMHGNQTPSGPNRNFSALIDAHTWYASGRNEQPGFRFGQGCAAPGATATAYAQNSLWHTGSSMELEVSARNGVPDDGTGHTQPFVCLGLGTQNVPFALAPGCALLTTTDVWFLLPGNNDGSGRYDGTLTGLPVLPAGHRLYAQVGSVDVRSLALVLGDVSGIGTPPPGPATLPAARIAHGTDRLSPTGTVSLGVPVTRFF